MSIGSFAIKGGRLDAQGNELNIGDKVLVALMNDHWRARDRFAYLATMFIVGDKGDGLVTISQDRPFKSKHNVHIEAVRSVDCILIKE